MTVTFGYADLGSPTLPTLTFLDTATNTFQPVVGSRRIPSSLTVDPIARLVTVILDATSTPSITHLTGTRLVISDLASPRVVLAVREG